VIVQSDVYAGSVPTLVVAEVTKNLSMANDAACLLIDLSTPEGKATGLLRNSVVSCLVLVTVYANAVDKVLGTLSPADEPGRFKGIYKGRRSQIDCSPSRRIGGVRRQ
jgi:hypothetical protein